MKNSLFLIILAFLNTLTSIAQVGIGTTTPAPSSILELSSTDKALVVTRVNSIYAISNPQNGMIIYDLSNNCMKFYANGEWTGCITSDGSTNGSASMAFIDCNIASTGTLTVGAPISGVTQTVNVFVTRIGSYNLTATQNGVTFFSTGTFTTLGSQNIVFTASNATTPTAAGAPVFFSINTVNACTFTRTINPASIFLGNCASISAQTYRGLNGNRYSCNCTNTDYLSGTIWGTNTYTDDSSIVRAAVHSGRIAPGTAGTITFRIAPGLGGYTSTTQNGITSSTWGAWGGSFDFN